MKTLTPEMAFIGFIFRAVLIACALFVITMDILVLIWEIFAFVCLFFIILYDAIKNGASSWFVPLLLYLANSMVFMIFPSSQFPKSREILCYLFLVVIVGVVLKVSTTTFKHKEEKSKGPLGE